MSVIFNQGKSIFIHAPKTGGATIKKSFLGGTGAGHYSLHTLINDRIDNLKNKLGNPPYNVYVMKRNPFDRVVSAWAFGKQYSSRSFPDSFTEFVLNFSDYIRIPPISEYLYREYHPYEKNVHFIPQWYFTHTTTKVPFTITYLSFENFAEDVKKLSKHAGIKDYKLLHWHRSTRDNWKEYYIPELKDCVYKYYERDFELFYPEIINE